MKKEILQMLRAAGDHFVSGQLLCDALGVSRQAVWKNISQLKELGYEIESVSNKGYHLEGTPDRLFAPDIESRFIADCCCKNVKCFDSLDSTNTRAKQLAGQGEPEGTLVVAEEQTNGRGRRGREWSAGPGVGVWMSLILRPQLLPQQSTGITLTAALAVVKGIREVSKTEPLIKWPNDIVIGGKKVCGMLTETNSEPDCIHYAVVGIGINANTPGFEGELSGRATSVLLESGEHVDRQALIAAVMNAFTGYYAKYLQTGDMSLLCEEYNRLLVNRDREVRILHGLEGEVIQEQIQTGIARGIACDGSLLVETERGLEHVVSGEVSVRGIYGYA